MLLINLRGPVTSIVGDVHQKGRLWDMEHSEQTMPIQYFFQYIFNIHS